MLTVEVELLELHIYQHSCYCEFNNPLYQLKFSEYLHIYFHAEVFLPVIDYYSIHVVTQPYLSPKEDSHQGQHRGNQM